MLCGHELALSCQLVSVLHCADWILLKKSRLLQTTIKLMAVIKTQVSNSPIKLLPRKRKKQHETETVVHNYMFEMNLKPHLIIQFISHGGFWSSGPFSTFSEVLLDQRSVGSVLKEAGPPRHRSLYYLITHNQEDVSGHGCIHACGAVKTQSPKCSSISLCDSRQYFSACLKPKMDSKKKEGYFLPFFHNFLTTN